MNDTSKMEVIGSVNLNELITAQKYFETHPDIQIADKSPLGMVTAYNTIQAYKKSNEAQQTKQQQAPQQQNTAPQQQSQSGDLFGALFDGFMRAAIHEAFYHHHHCACPHGRFAHLSFGLPPYMASHHDRFCHRIDARNAKNRVKTMTGAVNIADGINNIKHGNTAGGILSTISGATNIASVILDKKRGRC